jgi:hypothetical protein
MSFTIALTDERWDLLASLFDPPSRPGLLLNIRSSVLRGYVGADNVVVATT